MLVIDFFFHSPCVAFVGFQISSFRKCYFSLNISIITDVDFDCKQQQISNNSIDHFYVHGLGSVFCTGVPVYH